MAFTRTPTQSTEQTKLVPLMHEFSTRNISNTKDTDNLNVILEPVRNQLTADQYYQVIKRDGVIPFTTASPPPSAIYGAYYWDRGSAGFFLAPWYVVVGAFGTRIYDETGALIINDAGTWIDYVIGFTTFLFDNGFTSLIITDGTNIRAFRSDGVITIISGGVPTPHLPYPVFLDGYLFLSETVTGAIWNSNLNDPTTWSASNQISAESYPDAISAIARSGQYIVAFGKSSLQFFYDAANPTGTPLATQTTVLQIGYIGGLVSHKEDLYFLGAPSNGNVSVYKLSGLKAEPIANFPFSRFTNSEASNNLRDGYVAINGFMLLLNGHTLYTTTNITPSPMTPALTYALDLDTGLWVRLAYRDTGKLNLRSCVSARFPDYGLRSMITLDTSSEILQFNRDTYQDTGMNFPVMFQTPNLDFGTYRKKFGSRIMVHGDQTPSTSMATISWSDDDYQTYSTPRNIDMSSQYKQIWQLGSFRKRSFKFTYSDNFPMRWEFLELDYSQGSS